MRSAIAIAIALALSACTFGSGPEEEVFEPWVDTGTSEDILGYDTIPELGIELSPESMDALRAQPREWVKGYLLFDGGRYGPVGVHLKGQNSFQPIDEKPSFRIKVDEYIPDQTFHGLKDMTFNNMSTDPSMLHERLAYLVAREAGLPASRSNHAVLSVNGQSYGLYAGVETIKKRAVGGWFDDNEGPLFEATDVDFQEQYVPLYELKSGPDDRSLLDGAATALAETAPDQAMLDATAYVDYEGFLQYWAVVTIIGQWDAFPYSFPGDDYFTYADPTSQKLWLIPWGMDETFFAADVSPLMVRSVLATTCLNVPSCHQDYLDHVWALQAQMEERGLEAERVRVAEQIAPHIAADTRRPYDDAAVAEAQTQVGYFIRGRRTMLEMFLAPTQ
jgi:hypothetical protein